MRDVVTLGEIEALFILLVEIFNFGIRYGDFRGDLFVDELIDRDAFSELVSDVIDRHLLLFEQIFKLFFGVLAFELVELDVNFGIGGTQPSC